MVIGLLILSAIPTVAGVSLASNEQRKANERKNDERRMAKFYIDVAAPPYNIEDPEVHGKRVVLRDFKVSHREWDSSAWLVCACLFSAPTVSRRRGL